MLACQPVHAVLPATQNYSLHRELLPACHAMRLEALRTRGGTIDGVRFRLLSFVGGDLVDVTLRMRRVRDVKEVRAFAGGCS